MRNLIDGKKKKGKTSSRNVARKQTSKKKARRTRKTTDSASDDARPTGFQLRDDIVEEAIVSGEHRDVLETYFGEEGYAELQALAVRARNRPPSW